MMVMYRETFQMWNSRQWAAAVIGGIVTFLVLGIPTDIVPNPVFGRAIEPTWWSLPVLIVTSILSGLLLATYVNTNAFDRSARVGGVGGLMAYLAIGCPVCNKVVLLALGTTGAMNWFAPVQPYLGIAALGVIAYALHKRLSTMNSCALPISDNISNEDMQKEDGHVS
jgi:hypothetical protein